MSRAEAVFIQVFAVVLVLLWITGIAALIWALFKKKDPAYRYSAVDILSYVLDVLLLPGLVWLFLAYWGYGFAGAASGWKNQLILITDFVSLLAMPLSVWSIAISINLRKKGRSRDSFLAQFSTVPVHIICLMVYYLVFGPVY